MCFQVEERKSLLMKQLTYKKSPKLLTMQTYQNFLYSITDGDTVFVKNYLFHFIKRKQILTVLLLALKYHLLFVQQGLECLSVIKKKKKLIKFLNEFTNETHFITNALNYTTSSFISVSLSSRQNSVLFINKLNNNWKFHVIFDK